MVPSAGPPRNFGFTWGSFANHWSCPPRPRHRRPKLLHSNLVKSLPVMVRAKVHRVHAVGFRHPARRGGPQNDEVVGHLALKPRQSQQIVAFQFADSYGPALGNGR
jgi:hypothetical protein